MQNLELTVKQTAILLSPMGMAFLSKPGILIAADLHLDKGVAAARNGSLVPPWDTVETLNRLETVQKQLEPKILVLLGDSFHRNDAQEHLLPEFLSRFRKIINAQQTIWIKGNHDAAEQGFAEEYEEWNWEQFCFRHISTGEIEPKEFEISGHYHPKRKITTRAGKITKPCFVMDDYRMIMPSLGAYTGGMESTQQTIASLFSQSANTYLLGEKKVFSFPLHSITSLKSNYSSGPKS